ncbi:MAG TPA: hypothetical protein PKZ53_00530 [Acidobacteriota bacterium]|nr:hypothetical protein [Acidobacteriota bacterium]HNJ38946.1 hypothetical protein [Acidobacteriota bacterium]
MLRIVRYGYETPGVDVAYVEVENRPDQFPFPRLIHIEHHPDAQTALEAVGPQVAGIETISVCSCSTELLTGVEAAHYRPGQTPGVSECIAEYRLGQTLLLNKISSHTLTQMVGHSALADTACLITAFRTVYFAELQQLTQVAHIHIAERQIDLFVYDRGELVFHGTELPEDDHDSFMYSAHLLLTDPNARWRSHLDLIVFSGASQWLQANRLEWLDTQVQQSAQAQVFAADRLFAVELTDVDAQREVSRAESRFTRTGLPVLLAGAAVSFSIQHGADFRRLVPSEYVPPKSKGLVAVPQTPGQFAKFAALNLSGLALGAILGVGIVGYQYFQNSAWEKRLTNEKTVELKRESDNRQVEAEAKQLRDLIQALNNRIEVVNRMRNSQQANFEITNDIWQQIPPGVVLSRLLIVGRDITIEGYVTYSSVVEGQNPANTSGTADSGQTAGGDPQSSPPKAPSVVYFEDQVDQLSKNLSDSGSYSNVQSKLNQTDDTKALFTVIGTYTGEISSDPLTLQPLPEVVKQAAPEPSKLPVTK